MRWDNHLTRRTRKIQRLGNWTRWFAWHPVEINNRWVWLETVYRFGKEDWHGYIYFLYRTKENHENHDYKA